MQAENSKFKHIIPKQAERMASNGKYILANDEAHSSDGELEQEATHSGIDENNSDHDSECSETDSDCSKRPGSSSDSENQDGSENDGSTNDRSSAYSTGSVRSLIEDKLPSPTQKNQQTSSTNPEPQSNRTAEQEREDNGTSDRMKQIEKVLADLTKAISHFESSTPQPMNRETEKKLGFQP